MFFHRRKNAQITLNPTSIVVVDILGDHLDELLFAGKTPAIISLSFQNAPEALHRAIVNAVGHAGHTLCHTGLQQLVVKGPAGILEPSVTVEQRMGIRVRSNGLVKGFVNERIIISLTEYIGHDPPVIKVQDSAQVDFMYNGPLVPFELGHIGQPFFVGFLCIKLAVQKVLSNILGILGAPGTAVIAVLHGRTDIPGPANPQHSFIIDMETIIMAKIVVESPVTLVWAFHMDFFDDICQMLIFLGSAAQLSRIPFVVSRTGYMEQFTGRFNGESLFFMTFLNCLVKLPLSYF